MADSRELISIPTRDELKHGAGEIGWSAVGASVRAVDHLVHTTVAGLKLGIDLSHTLTSRVSLDPREFIGNSLNRGRSLALLIGEASLSMGDASLSVLDPSRFPDQLKRMDLARIDKFLRLEEEIGKNPDTPNKVSSYAWAWLEAYKAKVAVLFDGESSAHIDFRGPLQAMLRRHGVEAEIEEEVIEKLLGKPEPPMPDTEDSTAATEYSERGDVPHLSRDGFTQRVHMIMGDKGLTQPEKIAEITSVAFDNKLLADPDPGDEEAATKPGSQANAVAGVDEVLTEQRQSRA